MKTSNKSSLITGIALLVVAALFSISLILQPLDFGATGPGRNNIFYLLGNMLYSVYGFSSILIPSFLLIAGLSCFAAKWTARKTMRLLTALVPFFTCVVTENICRSIIALGKGSFSGVKIAIAVITGIMLIVIEWLGIGIIADKLNNKTSPKTRIGRISVPKTSTVFDEALSEVAPDKSPDKEADTTPDKTPEVTAKDETETEAESEAPATPLLTQEEYAALTTPEEDLGWNLPPAPESLPPEYDEDFDENDPALEFPPKEEEKQEDTASELEPVDAVEAFEEEAPAFDVDFDSEADDNENDNYEEIEEKKTSEPEIIEEESPYFDMDLHSDPHSDVESDIESDLDMDLQSTPLTDYADQDDFIEWTEADDFRAQEDSAQIEESEETPYSTTRYIDTVVENPNFPHGIVIHEDDENEEDEEEQAPVEVEKPKYPTKITIQSTPQVDPDFEDTFEDDYVEDETLPFPAFNDEEEEESPLSEPETTPAAYTPMPSAIPEQPVHREPARPQPAPAPARQTPAQQAPVAAAASSVFSDMENEIREEQAANPQPLIAPASTSSAQPEPAESPASPVASARPAQQARQAQEPAVQPAAHTAPAHAPAAPAHPTEVDFEGNVISHDGPTDLESSSGATNLTADELTDFFNAQQAENTPRTTEIQGSAPKIGGRAEKKGPYVIPSDLLIAYKDDQYWIIDDATKQAAMNLKQTLAEFNIEAEITGIKKGPVVTMFEILPAPGVKLSKIVALQDNIALSLAAQSVRIVAPIPGKQAVGIEVPNRHRSVVGFREIIEMDLPEWQKMAVPVVLGKDILGKAQLIDLVKTPHMLIAGATGSGKSVCVNSLILSILYKRSFRDVKLILVDPKVVELKLYNNIPHLLTPVITEPKKALQALQYCLCEMERRYALLDSMGVRDISNYNAKIKEQNICTEKLPYIVVIIDEFADLMATSGKELENIVARLTAMSRAVGIHLVLATQRPSVNVITGLIKANIPTRIAFMVASRTDSNIIIDTVGAEKLLGRGDMLYASAVDPAPTRIQGTFISDQEVEDVVNAVKEYGEPDYIDDEIFVDDEEDEARDLFGEPMDDDDPLYDQALEIVVQSGKASASYIQRRLKIGYNRAARLVEEMEERGIVGPANGSKPREIIHIPS